MRRAKDEQGIALVATVLMLMVMSGIGLALLPCFYAHGGCGGRAVKPGQLRFLSDLDGYWRLMEASARHVAAWRR